jgi:hypothetical protein
VSRTAKLLIAIGVVVGLATYVVIVDLGVNAGRIHYGVSVERVDVGGLTAPEAVDRLREHGLRLKSTAITFSAPGASCSFVPAQLGWGPQPADTTKLALAVGREGVPFQAVADRIRAWFGGVTVGWAGAADPAAVDDFLDECEASAAGQGLVIDRAQLGYRVRRAIVTWPRPVSFRFPLRRPAATPTETTQG